MAGNTRHFSKKIIAMEIKRINELIEKPSLTAEEKKEIREAADAIGLEYTIKKGKFCRECYEKILLKLYELNQPEKNKSKDGYVLRNIRNAFRIGGFLVNNSTISEIEVGKFNPAIINQLFEHAD